MAEPVLLLRFNDSPDDDLVRPVDEIGSLADLNKTGAAMPGIVGAALGFGRSFTSSALDGLAALDADVGSTLLTRNASIQAVLAWDFVSAIAYGSPQTIYARGKGTAAAEYLGAGLELRIIDPATRIAEVRWIWQTVAGVLRTQVGGHFQVPADGFVILTATRRWVSSSRVVLRYFLGDVMLAEVESADGDIGGGTTGTTSIGTRYNAGGAAWFRHFDGVIDELRVCDDELAPEEIAMTWRRITVEQPRGYRLALEAHDPGFPMSQDPSSRVQRETRMWGHALGFASAQAENVRENILPDRAYGEPLERWEYITRQSSKPGDDLDTRRARVVGKIRQRRGVSIPGVGDALAGASSLLDTDPANLEIVAFDQTFVETWATLNAERWRYSPAASFSLVASALRVQDASATRYFFRDWRTALASIGGNGRAARIRTKITPTTIGDGGEVGILFSSSIISRAADGFTFGIRNDAGTYKLSAARMVDGVGDVSTDHALAGMVPVWLEIDHDDAAATYTIKYATASVDGPYTTVASLPGGPTSVVWAGLYSRTWNPITTPTIDAAFSDTRVRAPYGERALRFYVLRDPALPGAPDYVGADVVLQGLKQAHTEGHVVRTLTALYDSSSTGYDREPMGGV